MTINGRKKMVLGLTLRLKPAAGFLLGLLLLLPSAKAQPARKRVSMLLAVQDTLSQQVAGQVEHLGMERLMREPGFELVSFEELGRWGKPSTEAREFNLAVAKLIKGLSYYENLDLKNAIRRLSAAVRRFEKVPGEVERDQQRSYQKALAHLGASLIVAGNSERGKEIFRRLLVYDPQSRLDKMVFPPGIVEQFESVRQDLSSWPTGSLRVLSEPSYGKVYLDGKFKGTSPCTLENLPAGKHLMVVRKLGYKTWVGGAVVKSGELQKLLAWLSELPQRETLLKNVTDAASSMDPQRSLFGGLQSLALEWKLDRLILGRLQRRGEKVEFLLSLYDVGLGKPVCFQKGTLQPGSTGFVKKVEGVFSRLIAGQEADSSPKPSLSDTTASAGKEEPLLVMGGKKSTDETWHQVVFWSGSGVTALGLVATALFVEARSDYLSGERGKSGEIKLWGGMMFAGLGSGVALMVSGAILWARSPSDAGKTERRSEDLGAFAGPTPDGRGMVFVVEGRW